MRGSLHSASSAPPSVGMTVFWGRDVVLGRDDGCLGRMTVVFGRDDGVFGSDDGCFWSDEGCKVGIDKGDG